MGTDTTSVVADRSVPAEGAGRSAPRRPRRGGIAYLFLSPWIAGAVLLTIGPMLASLYLSFTDYDLFTRPQWIGVENYRRMFTEDPRFLASVWVTLKYVLFAVPLKLALALGVALLLNRRASRHSRGQGLYRAAFYAPSLLGASVSIALVWRTLFGDGAIVDRLLRAVGLDTGGWVSQPRYALFTLIFLAAWQFGAPMVIFLAGLKQIPADLYDAVAVDGAGRWQTFRTITLPMLSPVIFFNLVLETIHAFQAFTPAYVVSGGRGGPSDATLFYTLYLYQRGFTDFRMGYASAMAWGLLIVIGLVTAVIFRSARLWVFYAEDPKGS
jgi:multiple sugar transport system permease protein